MLCLVGVGGELQVKSEKASQEAQDLAKKELGFGWWKFSGWVTLIVGTIYLLATGFGEYKVLGFILVILNLWLGVAILSMSRWAFLIGTIASLNPILWIINGIYLKKRWNHPRVIGEEAAAEIAEAKRVVSPPPLPESEPQLNEESLYEAAMREVQGGQRREGLWAMCFAQAGGNESAATAQYLTKRVQEMREGKP